MRTEALIAALAVGGIVGGILGVNKAYEKVLEDSIESSTQDELRGPGYVAIKSKPDDGQIRVEGFTSWGSPGGSTFGALRGRDKVKEVCGPIIAEDSIVIGGRKTVINVKVPDTDLCFPKK